MRLAADLRAGLRQFRHHPGSTWVSVLTIALGIAAVTAFVSIVDGVLLKPLPWPDADRLVRLAESRGGKPGRIPWTISNGSYREWRENATTVEHISGWISLNQTVRLESGSAPERLRVARVTPSMFTLLQTRPGTGRLFGPDEGRPGNDTSIILSHGLWRARFGENSAVIGASIEVDGRRHVVVGILPRAFVFIDTEAVAFTPWEPPAVLGEDGARRLTIFSAMARLRPGVSRDQAQAEGTARARSAPDPGHAAGSLFGSTAPPDIAVASAVDAMTSEVKPALLLLLVAGTVLFVVAIANVASVQVARASARHREMAIRAALGASRARIVRQLLIEQTVLGAVGGIAGLALALALLGTVPSILPADFPRVHDVQVDWRMALATVVLSLVSVLACGLAPALYAGRLNVLQSLASTSRGGTHGGRRGSAGRLRLVIMTAQVAAACLLLMMASLLVRSFTGLVQADRGYDPTNLLTARLAFPRELPAAGRVDALERITQRVTGMPGVTTAAYGNALPFVSAGGFLSFDVSTTATGTTRIQSARQIVSPEYFAALRLRLVAGRPLNPADTAESRPVIVVNRSFAREYLGNEAAGHIIRFPARPPTLFRSDVPAWEVIGVVDDVRQGGPDAAPSPQMFASIHQAADDALSGWEPIVVIRVKDDPAAQLEAFRGVVRQEAPSAAFDSALTMDERITVSLARPRTYALLLSGFAAFAVIIAGVGLFGVLAYSVAQRRREIGLRRALGAQQHQIVRLVVLQAVAVTAVGIVAGIWLSTVTAGLAANALYGVVPNDTASMVFAALAVATVAMLACLVPARRAAAVDPLVALTSE